MSSREFTAASRVHYAMRGTGDHAMVEQSLLSQLAAGLAYARASKFTTTVGAKITTAASKGIDASLWALARNQPAALASLWSIGELRLTEPSGALHEMVGVMFDKQHIDAFMLNWAVPADRWIQTKGRPAAAWWSLFAVELVRHCHENGIPGDDSEESITAVVAAVQKRLAPVVKKGPDAASIRPTVELLVQRHAGKL